MISTVEKVLFLKGVDLFKSIPGEDLTHIAAIAEQVDFLPATPFPEGEPGETMFLILSGTVDIRSGDTVVKALGLNSALVKWRSSMPNHDPPPSKRQAS